MNILDKLNVSPHLTPWMEKKYFYKLILLVLSIQRKKGNLMANDE